MPDKPIIYVEKKKPPYLLGLLCLIPLVGAFVGLGLLLYGLIHYKDKWLSIIGGAGILFTVVIYGSLFYAAFHSKTFNNGFTEIAQMQLNELVKDVEFYKLQHGSYPDKLQQIERHNTFVNIHDPSQGMRGNGGIYNYKK